MLLKTKVDAPAPGMSSFKEADIVHELISRDRSPVIYQRSKVKWVAR